MSKKYVSFGKLLRNNRDDGFYFRFDDDLDITVNGQKINIKDNPFVNAEEPIEKYKRFVKSGRMTEVEFEEKESQLDGSKTRLEFTVVQES